jgi:hypothetical protein
MPQPNPHSAVEHLFKSLATNALPAQCKKCGSKLMALDTTFFSPGPTGHVWTVPLPVCPKCDLKEDSAQFVPPIVC